VIQDINLILNRVKNTSSIVQAIKFAEQADKLGLEEVSIIEAMLVD